MSVARLPDEDRFWRKVARVPDGCWNWTASTIVGNRGQIGVSTKGGFRKNYLASRVAFTFANGDIPDGMVVMHTCDNPLCCRPSHLVVGTQKDNLQDMSQKFRGMHGSRSYHAKITEAQAIEMRERRAAGWPQQALADAYGLTQGTVSVLLNRKTWRHV